MLELNQVYNMDCMERMARFPHGYFDLAIVDPEWGRKEHGGKDRSSFAKQKNGSRIWVKDAGYKKYDWDCHAVGDHYFSELFRVSKHQIIWGCNYFGRSFGPGRIVWDKVNGESDQSDCELAYNSLTDRVDLIRYMWAGMMQGKSISEGHIMQGDKSKNEKRIHPTQKPVVLYKWQLSTYAKPGWKILDTHSGSASHFIACMDLGFDCIAFEKERDYYQDSIDRINDFKAQLKLFS